MSYSRLSFTALVSIAVLSACTGYQIPMCGAVGACKDQQGPMSATVTLPTDAGDWSGYNRNLAGDRFSPLAEINTTNVGQLKTICSYTLPEVTALQTGPIVGATST